MGVDILVGHHLPLYREVLTSAIRAACPGLVVQAVLPDELERFLSSSPHPQMVICGDPSPAIRDRCPNWISLFPHDADEVIVNIRGNMRTIPHPSISRITDILRDECQRRTMHPNG